LALFRPHRKKLRLAAISLTYLLLQLPTFPPSSSFNF
jgi:hypothetical protein